MPFVTPYEFTALELLTAAKMNAIQDNISALWPYTTEGDLPYAASGSVLARLGIGAEYQNLKVVSGLPAWADTFQRCIVYKSSDQTISDATPATVVWEAEGSDLQGWHSPSVNPSRITVIETGYYIPFVTLYFNRSSGGSGNFHITSRIQLNGTDTANKITIPETVDLNSKLLSYGGMSVYMTAGQYLTVTFEQDSGDSGLLISGVGYTQFSLLRIG